MKTDIFLSHSSEDKPDVRRLKVDLEKNGFSTWLDEDEIGIGDRIATEVQKGLTNSKFLIIWLTSRAVKSGWVEREWQSQLLYEIESKNTIILPLLAEDCEIPEFLKGKKYADFRKDYNSGFNQLIVDLKKKLS